MVVHKIRAYGASRFLRITLPRTPVNKLSAWGKVQNITNLVHLSDTPVLPRVYAAFRKRCGVASMVPGERPKGGIELWQRSPI